MEKVRDNGLINELKTRGIGFEKNGDYFIDDMQATYLTEMGKAEFSDAAERVKCNEKLALQYRIFKDLRKRMHTVNYMEKDSVFLVHDKGIIPKNDESKYVVKVLEESSTFDEIIELIKSASQIRKIFIAARIQDDSIRYYKIQRMEM